MPFILHFCTLIFVQQHSNSHWEYMYNSWSFKIINNRTFKIERIYFCCLSEFLIFPLSCITKHGWSEMTYYYGSFVYGTILFYYPVIDNQLVELYLFCIEDHCTIYELSLFWANVLPLLSTFYVLAGTILTSLVWR